MEQFEALRQQEQKYFLDMVQQCKDSGATLVVCQWGERAGRAGGGSTALLAQVFGDTANHLLMHNGLSTHSPLRL